MEVGIVAQRNNRRAWSLAARLVERLRERDVAVVVDGTTAESLRDLARWDDADGSPPEGIAIDEMAERTLVVSIGGDGTFLYTARGAGSTPIVGVNLGEVGFLNAVSPDDAVEVVLGEVERIRETGSPRTRTSARIAAEGEGWSVPPACNEVVVHGPRRGHGGGADLAVRVDGSLYASGHADGVLVATPTGSTAYNLSEDGPLVHPAVDGLIVTEMAGEAEMPPLVVDDDSEVVVQVEGPEDAVVVSDGRIRRRIETPERIRIARAAEPVTFAGPRRDFFAALGKLG